MASSTAAEAVSRQPVGAQWCAGSAALRLRQPTATPAVARNEQRDTTTTRALTGLANLHTATRVATWHMGMNMLIHTGPVALLRS